MRKGFTTSEEVETFLRPRLSSLSDPFLLPNMQAAVERIFRALDQHERIVLFGDYDVDGVTSIALLAEMLRACGCAPELFLPRRMEEGYGLSREGIDRCLEQHGPQLLVAVDCGTSSVTEIAQISQRGVDVIVLDHHEPPLSSSGFTGEPRSALPDCIAVVNPCSRLDRWLDLISRADLTWSRSARWPTSSLSEAKTGFLCNAERLKLQDRQGPA